MWSKFHLDDFKIVEVVWDTIFVNRGYLNILIKGHNSGTPLLKVCHALYLDMRNKLLIKNDLKTVEGVQDTFTKQTALPGVWWLRTPS